MSSSNHPGPKPRWIGAYAERVMGARGHQGRLERIVERSAIPTVIFDDERRYVDANTPARLAFRRSLAELARLRLGDLTQADSQLRLDTIWAALMATGCVNGRYGEPSPQGGVGEVFYYALRDALPGRHLVAFAPASWPDRELRELDRMASAPETPLTPRELEVLELASEGLSGPMIARELVVSAATVRTHFEHIYAKLGARDRAAAVATAIRLGLII